MSEDEFFLEKKKMQSIKKYFVFFPEHDLPINLNSFQSHLFRNVDDAYKRAVAKIMYSEFYTQGEVIITQGKETSKLFYIARGSVQILSGNDGESPILTLDMGSILGGISLMIRNESLCHVIASSFCIVHVLNKADLWRVALDYKKLKQTKKMHKIASVSRICGILFFLSSGRKNKCDCEN